MKTHNPPLTNKGRERKYINENNNFVDMTKYREKLLKKAIKNKTKPSQVLYSKQEYLFECIQCNKKVNGTINGLCEDCQPPKQENPYGDHETHYACDEMIKKYGDKTLGCCCSGHKCKPPKSSESSQNKGLDIKEWVKGFLMEIKIIGRDELNNFELQDIDEERAIELIKELLSSQRKELSKKIENMKEDDRPEITKWLVSKDFTKGYNRALFDILEILR